MTSAKTISNLPRGPNYTPVMTHSY